MNDWRGVLNAVCAVDGASWFGEPEPDAEDLVGFLLDRQVRSGRNAGLFEPTNADFEDRRLVTGERLKTKLATTQIASQEAARTLHVLGGGSPTVAAAVRLAAARLGGTCYGGPQHCTVGECAASFIGYLRFLQAVGGCAAAPEVAWRLRTLTGLRDGAGRWKRSPFYYTLLVLTEVGPAGRDELEYALPALARSVGAAEQPFAARRARIALRAAGP